MDTTFFTRLSGILFLFFNIAIPGSSLAQNSDTPLYVGGMEITWHHSQDTITFTASAPDDGWIALGFHTENTIVGSNLIMIGVKGTVVTSEDFYVIGAGNPRPVDRLRSRNQIRNPSGHEDAHSTTVTFSIPTKALDKYHKNLAKGKKIWLICAYSMEDEFDHHSRMRKHVQVTL
ncbi:MAG: DOMON domain-containing protein [Bacteroidota bacterium]